MSNNKNLLKYIVKGSGMLIGLATAAYGGYLVKKELEKNGLNLKIKTIADALEEKNKAIINFKDIVKEEWDYLFIFPAFTSYESIYDALGFEWDEVYKTGISYKDDISLLVFVKGNNVVRYIEYPKDYGDFSSLEKDVYEEGTFELYKNKKNKILVKESFD